MSERKNRLLRGGIEVLRGETGEKQVNEGKIHVPRGRNGEDNEGKQRCDYNEGKRKKNIQREREKVGEG